MSRWRFSIAVMLLATVFVNLAAMAAMIDSKMDGYGPPFSYFYKPIDALGVPGGRRVTAVTYEGYLYTGAAELMFFEGNKLTPVTVRIKQLKDERLPILQYELRHGDVRYRFEMFAWRLDGHAERPLVNFVRVRIRNTGPENRTAVFAAACRYRKPDHRPKTMIQVPFNPNWMYKIERGRVLRDGKIIYTFPTSPAPEKRAAIDVPYEKAFSGKSCFATEDTPLCFVIYRKKLAPQDSMELVFKMPATPLSRNDTKATEELAAAKYEAVLKKCSQFWSKILQQGQKITLPERELPEAFSASLAYMLMSQEKRGDDVIQWSRAFDRTKFSVRDACLIARAYDIAGLPEEAASVLAYLLKRQNADSWNAANEKRAVVGRILWAIGEHVKLAGDKDFAQRAFPFIQKMTARLRSVNVGAKPTGAIASECWALAGLRGAAAVVGAAGRPNQAKRLNKLYSKERNVLVKRVRDLAKKTGGVLPATWDGKPGNDWSVLDAVYPCEVINPYERFVTNTLRQIHQEHSAEGMITRGEAIIDPLATMRVAQIHLSRGESKQALDCFYNVLAHTTATWAGTLGGVRAWSDRDCDENYPPDAVFAAEYIVLLRNLSVKEEDGNLILGAGMSPAWMLPFTAMSTLDAPTYFGPTSFFLSITDNGADMKFDPKFRNKPQRVILHIPWFAAVTNTSGRTSPLTVTNSQIAYAPGRIESNFMGDIVEFSQLSYVMSVYDFISQYRSKARQSQNKGGKLLTIEPEKLVPLAERKKLFRARFSKAR